jgi:threonine/homoserine/homoserine lactone efflux protein
LHKNNKLRNIQHIPDFTFCFTPITICALRKKKSTRWKFVSEKQYFALVLAADFPKKSAILHSMPLFWKGILFGLSLSILVGPLLFALISASLERDFRAGLAFAGGIWTSDAFFIGLVYQSVEKVAAFTALPGFRFWASLVGGVILAIMGLQMISRNKKNVIPNRLDTTAIGEKVLDRLDGHEEAGVDHNWRRWGYFGYFARGFLMNTFNPFTIFFWLAFSTTVVLPSNWNKTQVTEFFFGMLGALVATDVLKAMSARKLKQLLTPQQIKTIQFGIGLMIVVFGLFLIFRAFLEDYAHT